MARYLQAENEKIHPLVKQTSAQLQEPQFRAVKRSGVDRGRYHVGAVAVAFVRYDRRSLAGQGRRAAAGRVDAFLLLPAVTEPNPNHLLLHVQLLRHQQDLL